MLLILVPLPVGLKAYRPLGISAVQIPRGRRRLWKSCDSEDLNLGSLLPPGSKYTSSSRRWVSFVEEDAVEVMRF
jgi:hypothetical protein